MKVLIAMLSLVILLSAYPALAEWPHGEPGFRGPRPEGGRLLERLIDSCRARCFDQARTCRDAAETTMLTSVQGSCPGQIQAAQIACKPDHTSPGCQDAKSTLRSCAQPAMKTLRSDLYSCGNPA